MAAELNERALSGLGRLVPKSLSWLKWLPWVHWRLQPASTTRVPTTSIIVLMCLTATFYLQIEKMDMNALLFMETLKNKYI
jgi:hypothetical protein